MPQNDDFLSIGDIFSHEFKTPLAVIMSHANNIEKRYNEGNMDEMDIPMAVEAIRLCCNSLARLSSNMALASKNKKIEAHRVRYDIKSQFDSICFIANDLFDEYNINAYAKLDYKAASPYFSLDPDLIQEVLMNLISNAVKYNSSDKKLIEVNCDIINERLIILVKDNGIGIEKEEAEKIFNAYYRSDNRAVMRASGLGIGLSIVSRIIKAHNGTIEARPQKQGTVFKIVIPEPGNIMLGSPRFVSVSKEKVAVGLADILER